MKIILQFLWQVTVTIYYLFAVTLIIISELYYWVNKKINKLWKRQKK